MELKRLNIVAWASDGGAVGHYRIIWPMGCLAGKGFADITTFVNVALDNEVINKSDLVVLQRVMGNQSVAVVHLLKNEGKKVVVEVDDDLFNISKFNPVRSKITDDIKDSLKEIYRSVDLVTVTTEPLAESIRKYNKNVSVLPNCLPLDMVSLKQCSTENGVVKICWSGGITHEADNALITEALRYVVKKYPNVKLIIQSPEVPASWKVGNQVLSIGLKSRHIEFIGIHLGMFIYI